MEKDFNFNKVGKRMPYSVPDGFFDEMEENVMSSLTTSLSRREGARRWRFAGGFFLAVAASVALLFIVKNNMPKNDTTAYTFDNVELAYNNLSTDDQQFLIEMYEDDIINENEDEN